MSDTNIAKAGDVAKIVGVGLTIVSLFVAIIFFLARLEGRISRVEEQIKEIPLIQQSMNLSDIQYIELKKDVQYIIQTVDRISKRLENSID